jgi:hypothetical protein
MLCHWRYLLDDPVGGFRTVFCLAVNRSPERVDELGARYLAEAEDAACASSSSRAESSLRSTAPGVRAPGRSARAAGRW